MSSDISILLMFCTFAISNSFASARSRFSTRVRKALFSSSPGDGEKRNLDSFVCLVREENLTNTDSNWHSNPTARKMALERSNTASRVKGICVCHRSHCCYGWAMAQKLDQISSLLSEVQFHVRNSENPPPKTGAAFINMDCKLMTSFTWTRIFCAN